MDRTITVGNARFFICTGPHEIGVVAAAAGCAKPAGAATLTGLASLETAEPDHVSFLESHRHAALLERTRAGAVLVRPEMAEHLPAGSIALVTADPAGGWARVASLFHPARPIIGGIHPAAVVSPTATVDESAEISPLAIVGPGASIGPRCRIGPGAVIETGVVLGADCWIGANASISHATLGARVRVYPGARIGQEGFGFTITGRGFTSAPQLASVVIGDDVEIGANSTVDRGALRDTVIGDGTRLDNLVQVAHGVRIGRHCAIAAQVGLSGSCELGDFVVMGGQAGVADGMRVGSKVRIGAQAGVMSVIDDGATVVGSPARPPREVFREIATLKKLSRGRA